MGSIGNLCSNGSKIIISKDKKFTATIISDISSSQNYSNKTNNILLINSSTKQESNQIDKCYASKRSQFGHSNSECKIPYNPLPFVKIIPKKLRY